MYSLLAQAFLNYTRNDAMFIPSWGTLLLDSKIKVTILMCYELVIYSTYNLKPKVQIIGCKYEPGRHFSSCQGSDFISQSMTSRRAGVLFQEFWRRNYSNQSEIYLVALSACLRGATNMKAIEDSHYTYSITTGT